MIPTSQYFARNPNKAVTIVVYMFQFLVAFDVTFILERCLNFFVFLNMKLYFACKFKKIQYLMNVGKMLCVF